MTDLVTSERKVFAVGSRHEPVTVVDSVSQTSKKPKPNFRRTYETAKNTQNGDFRLIWQRRTFSYSDAQCDKKSICRCWKYPAIPVLVVRHSRVADSFRPATDVAVARWSMDSVLLL